MKRKVGFGIFLWPFISFMAFAALLLVERIGVQYSIGTLGKDFIPQEMMQEEKPIEEKECLILFDSRSSTAEYHKSIMYVLDSMRIGYDTVDLARGRSFDPKPYKTVIVSMANLESMQEGAAALFGWVAGGGRVLFAMPPQPTDALDLIRTKLGILNGDLDYGLQNRMRFDTDLMPGAKGREFTWGQNDRYGLEVLLSKDCTVHMTAIGEWNIPMLWERSYGKGKIVVNNNDAFLWKESRGLVAAAYSLLEDVCAYPVINASMFFIDDFPSPVPEGYHELIYKQYQCDVATYYTNIWHPDMIGFAHRYGIKYTGLIVETYGDNVTPLFRPLKDTASFRYFGGMLLGEGGEMGLHGYNHMPLVLSNFDYMGLLNYKKWNSIDDMETGIREVIRFTQELFPGVELKTYVPPSNILSDEGRRMLKERFPQINTISGVYLNENYGFVQEFDISDDGIINLPRIISGCVLDEYMEWVALNEINFHYVNSHFLHPDDALDPERGALEGWEALKERLGEYLEWLYGSAKGIRSLTAQEGAMAVQRYCNLKVERKSLNDKYILNLDGFYDEAWLMLRFNKGKPGIVEGGTMEHICGNLYLLHAIRPQVVISVER